MPTSDINLADRAGGLIESHKGYQPRIVFFYFVVAALFLLLAGGLGYRQILQEEKFGERERIQNHRRIVTPGPRGDILDREGRVLAGSKPKVAVAVLLDEMRREFRLAAIKIHNNYKAAIEKGAIDMSVPTDSQLNRIARVTVLQKYLDQINAITGKAYQVDQAALESHFTPQRRLLPYVLIRDLEAADYARLLEQLPTDSPLQIYPTNARVYPFGSAATHTIGSVQEKTDIEAPQLPQEDLTTFRMPGLEGREWLEKRFDSLLQGSAGGKILRVDPSGYRINEPLAEVPAKQGRTLTTSLDIDLQLAAEAKLHELEAAGAAVALDVRTGEVLTLAVTPNYDLNRVSPRIGTAYYQEIIEAGALYNRGIQGAYSPGSAFKILVTIAGLRSGTITPESKTFCPGFYMVGNRRFACHDSTAHEDVDLAEAIEKSCNVFFYHFGLLTKIDAIAAEARRFGFGTPSGIELPGDRRGLIPDPAWKRELKQGAWTDGDTANVAIGQGAVDVSPIQMAAFIASVARGETRTVPTLIHDPNRAAQRSEPIGLSPEQYRALIADMQAVVLSGTARGINAPRVRIPGLTIAGKTGTAQRETAKGTINFAWFICFAPVENPQIAIAVCVEGDVPGEEFGGGSYAAPIAREILAKWWEKKNAPARPTPLAPVR